MSNKEAQKRSSGPIGIAEVPAEHRLALERPGALADLGSEGDSDSLSLSLSLSLLS